MAKYELKSDYWDGRVMRKRGEVVDFRDKPAPKGSTLVEEPKPKPAAKSADS